MRNEGVLLAEMLLHIGYLEKFALEGKEALYGDIKTQFAIRLAYEIVGDIAKQLPSSLLEKHPKIPWKDIKGMRDVLAHQYYRLDLEAIWRAIESLPELRVAIETMIASLPSDENDL